MLKNTSTTMARRQPVLLPPTGAHEFPPADQALDDPDGLLAIGGNLSAHNLLIAYRQGIFPWFEDDQLPLWFCPSQRLVLKPTEFKLSKSLKKQLKKPYQIRFDRNFRSVIEACAGPRAHELGTWITSGMIDAYCDLFEQGWAHSVEVYWQERCVGGLYGLSIGGGFYGESMFHHRPDASKIALHALCQQIAAWSFDFIDCQLPNPHLERLGAQIISRDDFLSQLRHTLEKPSRQGHWQYKEG